jgi:hypothetical protein
LGKRHADMAYPCQGFGCKITGRNKGVQ